MLQRSHYQDGLDPESDLRMGSMIQCAKMRNLGRADNELNSWDGQGDAECRATSKTSLKHAHEARHEAQDEAHCHIA